MKKEIIKGYEEAEKIVFKDDNIDEKEKVKIIDKIQKAKEEAIRGPLDWDA